MRGRIKMIDYTKEFGFILGEDKNSYYFNFNEIDSVDLPKKNSIVNFKPASNEKGLYAMNIETEEENRKFIKIDDIRIPLDSIESYGFEVEMHGHQENYGHLWIISNGNVITIPSDGMYLSDKEGKKYIKMLDDTLGV